MEHVMLGTVFCQDDPVVPTLFFMLSSQEHIHTTTEEVAYVDAELRALAPLVPARAWALSSDQESQPQDGSDSQTICLKNHYASNLLIPQG